MFRKIFSRVGGFIAGAALGTFTGMTALATGFGKEYGLPGVVVGIIGGAIGGAVYAAYRGARYGFKAGILGACHDFEMFPKDTQMQIQAGVMQEDLSPADHNAFLKGKVYGIRIVPIPPQARGASSGNSEAILTTAANFGTYAPALSPLATNSLLRSPRGTAAAAAASSISVAPKLS